MSHWGWSPQRKLEVELSDFKGLWKMAAYSLENAAMKQLVGRGDTRCCNVCTEVREEQIR